MDTRPEIYNCLRVNPKLDPISYMEKKHLKALNSFTANGLVVRFWVYKSNDDCSYPTRVTCCNNIYKKAF